MRYQLSSLRPIALLLLLSVVTEAEPLISSLGGGFHGIRMQPAPDASVAYALVVTATSGDPQAVPLPELSTDLAQGTANTEAGVYVREEWDKGAFLCDGFSVRWTATLNIEKGGEYTFYLTTDDGTRMTIDGKTVIDAWVPRPPTISEVKVNLAAGDHEVVVEYYEAGGAATARLEWSAEGFGRQIIPLARIRSDGARGWKAEYFSNTTLAGKPILTQVEPSVDYVWGDGGPKIGDEEPGKVVLEWTRVVDNAIVGRVHSEPKSKIVLLAMAVEEAGPARPDFRVEMRGPSQQAQYDGNSARIWASPTQDSCLFIAGFEPLPQFNETQMRTKLTDAWLTSAKPNLPPYPPDAEGWITLFDGKSFQGWKSRGRDMGNWVAHDGMLENTGGGTDILTEWTFADYDLHIEFTYKPGSNSGVYFQGRYEVQVADSYGRPPESHQCGALYGIQAPTENVTKPAGEWQSFDVSFIAAKLDDHGRVVPARISVTHNGVLTIKDAEIPHATGGELDRNLLHPGPVMLQGTHGPVTYCNIKIRPR
ncbi:MAG: family 16 glycoside hydrolase [Candidatus Zipacnadales bacterium]